MEPSKERNFTIVDSGNMSTLAFLIHEPEAGTNYCTLQKLDCTFPDAADTRKKMFHLEGADATEENKDIVLLTLNGEKAFLNGATLAGNDLFVTKQPAKVGFTVLYNEENVDYKDLKYTPNFKRPISIIMKA